MSLSEDLHIYLLKVKEEAPAALQGCKEYIGINMNICMYYLYFVCIVFYQIEIGDMKRIYNSISEAPSQPFLPCL